jgi:large repetitive protein
VYGTPFQFNFSREKLIVNLISDENPGRFWVKPGVTVSEDVFLDYNLVTVEWEVTETAIQDRYEIVLYATYLTHVPAPVVVFEPTSVSLSYMKAGDVLNGELTMTNWGLVRADGLSFEFPADDGHFQYEFMKTIPSSLPAMERITIPYRVTCKTSLDRNEEEDGSGGVCGYGKRVRTRYHYSCANGMTSSGSASAHFTGSGAGCGGESGSGSWGTGPRSGSGGSSGKGSSTSGSSMGRDCPPPLGGCKGTCCAGSGGGGGFGGSGSGGGGGGGGGSGFGDGFGGGFGGGSGGGGGSGSGGSGGGGGFCGPPDKDGQCHSTGSEVNLASRNYQTEMTDLSVKAAGGFIDVNRGYYNDRWYWNHLTCMEYPRFDAASAGMGGNISGTVYYKDKIKHNDVVFKKIDDLTYTYDNYKIIITQTDEQGDPALCRWEDPFGNWRIYQKMSNNPWKARMTSWGRYDKTFGHVLYQNGVLSGISDKFGNQVLWYEAVEHAFSTGSGAADPMAEQKINAVWDAAGRRVEYGSRFAEYNGRIQLLCDSVRDVNGNATSYVYSLEPEIQYAADAADSLPAQPIGLPTGGGGGSGSLVGPGTYTPPKRLALAHIDYPGPRETIISYNPYGEVASVVDENGVGYTFDYDYSDADKEFYAYVRSGSGMIKEVWFDKEGYTKRIAVNGRLTREIQKNGRRYRVTDENGQTTTYDYDEWDNLTQVVYADGSRVTVQYDAALRKPVRRTNENGMVTTYQYDSGARMIRKVEGYGTAAEKATEFDYDADGNLIRITLLGDGRTPAAVTTMTYDDAGNMISLSDPEGHTTTFTHDVMGNVLTRTDGVNHTWTYTYDPAGRMTSATDPLGHTTAYEYDAAGNKVREVDAQGLEKLYEYDGRNNPVKITLVMDPSDPGQHRITRYEYNTDNKLIRQVDPSGKPIAYVYDNEGRLIRSIDGNGNEIHMEYDQAVGGCATCSGGGGFQPTRTVFPTFEQQYGYDLRGRKTLETDIPSTGGDLGATLFAYDPAGNLVEKTDKEGNTTVYEYDELGRLIGVTDPLTGMTSYEYDGRDNLIALTDAEGNTTRFDYDRNNRLTREIRPMDQQTVYAYDAAGNLTEKTDAKNQKTAYAYDAAGRLVQIDYFTASNHATPQKTVAFTYDASGNITGYDDGVTSAAYGYDAASRKIAETVNFGPFSKSNAYTYYPNNRKQSFTGPDGQTYTYYYDAADQFTGINIPGAGFVGINEYQWTRPLAMTYPGGMTRSFDYDPLMITYNIFRTFLEEM